MAMRRYSIERGELSDVVWAALGGSGSTPQGLPFSQADGTCATHTGAAEGVGGVDDAATRPRGAGYEGAGTEGAGTEGAGAEEAPAQEERSPVSYGSPNCFIWTLSTCFVYSGGPQGPADGEISCPHQWACSLEDVGELKRGLCGPCQMTVWAGPDQG